MYSLSVEQAIRNSNEEICRAHESALNEVPVTDYDNIKEIKNIPDSIYLQNIYRVPVDTLDGISIRIVDGYMIRKNLYPDFGFSGNDSSSHSIPPNEIWIDGQVSCEETEYSIAIEMIERKGIKDGKSYVDAVDKTLHKRQLMEKLAESPFSLEIPETLYNNSGTIDPSEK